jgi:four helix bundle protein
LDRDGTQCAVVRRAEGGGRRAEGEGWRAKGRGRRVEGGKVGGKMKDERKEAMKRRTKDYSLAIIRLYAQLPKRTEAQIIGKQLLRSATSVGAHYREACQAKSNADFISKIEGGLQEIEESEYWLELLTDSGLVASLLLNPISDETHQLKAIFITIVHNVKTRSK